MVLMRGSRRGSDLDQKPQQPHPPPPPPPKKNYPYPLSVNKILVPRMVVFFILYFLKRNQWANIPLKATQSYHGQFLSKILV